MPAQTKSSAKRKWVADDYLAGDAAGGFEPRDLCTDLNYEQDDVFGANAEEALSQAECFGNCLETKCVAECPEHLVELDKNGNCPECGKNLCSIHHTHVHFVRQRRHRLPVRKIA